MNPKNAAVIDLSKLTPEQIAQAISMQSTDAKKEIAKATRETLKSEKAELKGEVVGVKLDGSTLWIGITPGSDAGKTGKGEDYLFQADGIRFDLNGRKWRLGAVYAIEVK